MTALLWFKSLCVLTEGYPHWRHAMLCLGMLAWYREDASVEETLPHADFIIMFMSDSLMGSVLSSYVYSQLERFSQLNKQTKNTIKENFQDYLWTGFDLFYMC